MIDLPWPCFKFSAVFQHCWSGDSTGIWLVSTIIDKDSLLQNQNQPEKTARVCCTVLQCDPAISSFLPLTCTAAVPTEWHNYSVSSLLYSCHYKQILNVILTASAANTCNQYNLNLEAQTDQSESDYWLRPSSGLSPSSTASMWVIWSSSSTMSRSLITAGWSCYSHNICQNSHTLIVKVH